MKIRDIRWCWSTSGIKNEYYEVPDKKPKARRTVADVPRFGVSFVSADRYGVNGEKDGKWCAKQAWLNL